MKLLCIFLLTAVVATAGATSLRGRQLDEQVGGGPNKQFDNVLDKTVADFDEAVEDGEFDEEEYNDYDQHAEGDGTSLRGRQLDEEVGGGPNKQFANILDGIMMDEELVSEEDDYGEFDEEEEYNDYDLYFENRKLDELVDETIVDFDEELTVEEEDDYGEFDDDYVQYDAMEGEDDYEVIYDGPEMIYTGYASGDDTATKEEDDYGVIYDGPEMIYTGYASSDDTSTEGKDDYEVIYDGPDMIYTGDTTAEHDVGDEVEEEDAASDESSEGQDTTVDEDSLGGNDEHADDMEGDEIPATDTTAAAVRVDTAEYLEEDAEDTADTPYMADETVSEAPDLDAMEDAADSYVESPEEQDNDDEEYEDEDASLEYGKDDVDRTYATAFYDDDGYLYGSYEEE